MEEGTMLKQALTCVIMFLAGVYLIILMVILALEIPVTVWAGKSLLAPSLVDRDWL